MPFRDLFQHVPSTTDALLVAPLAVEHVLIELRTPQGEMLSAAAYRDIQALMGREAPIWARTASGELVRVTAHTRASLADHWWESVLHHFATSADPNTPERPAASNTLPESAEFLGIYPSIPAYMRAMLEPEITPACAWILDHLDYQAVQRKWEEDGSRLVIERGHIYRLRPPGSAVTAPEGEGRAQEVAADSLELFAVATVGGGRGVEIHAEGGEGHRRRRGR